MFRIRQSKIKPLIVPKVYEAKGRSAEKKVNEMYAKDAAKMAADGYFPTAVTLQRQNTGALVRTFMMTTSIFLFVTYELRVEKAA